MRFSSRFFVMFLASWSFVPSNPPVRRDLPLYSGRAPAALAGARVPLGGHSHNDYEQAHPLLDALRFRFPSVEADIWLRGDELLVSHYGLSFYGSLQELYLNPLRERVARLGSVHGDGRPFYLWIEIKSRDPELVPVLHRLLKEYPFLTVFNERGVLEKAVTVILTGNGASKAEYVSRFSERFACRDDHSIALEDSRAGPGWCWYSLRWGDFFGWNGRGPMPRNEREILGSLTSAVHERGRRIRFYGGPDTEESWAASYDAGVDLIETDSQERLAGFLSGRAAARSPLARY